MRMQRQKVYIQSFMNTVLQQTKKDLTTPLDLFNASAPYSCTNLNPSKVTYLAQQAVLGGVNGIDMLSVPGQVKMGLMYAEIKKKKNKKKTKKNEWGLYQNRIII